MAAIRRRRSTVGCWHSPVGGPVAPDLIAPEPCPNSAARPTGRNRDVRVGRRAVGVADLTVNYHQPYHPRGDARRFAVAAGLIGLGSTLVFGQTPATKSLAASGHLLVRGTWGAGFRLPTFVPLFNAPGRLESPAYRPARLLHSHEVADLDGRKCESGSEKSKTYSYGFVYSLKAISGLSINADYYFGEIKGLVDEGAEYILNVNAAGQGAGFVRGNPATINPNAPFAALITLRPVARCSRWLAPTLTSPPAGPRARTTQSPMFGRDTSGACLRDGRIGTPSSTGTSLL